MFINKGCNVAPGTYEINGSVQKLLDKKTGKRGPYDLMTGPRSFTYVRKSFDILFQIFTYIPIGILFAKIRLI